MKPTKGSKPVCWWCKTPIPLDTRNRAEAPELGLPTGSGVIVCTPACPKRPEGIRVYRHPQWRTT